METGRVEKLKIDTPLDGSVELVALELMKIIANAESKEAQGQEFAREYYLKLYSKCLKTVVLRAYEG